MTTQIRIAPKNSLLLIMDDAGREIPESTGGKLVATTASCIAVGTLSEADGDTLVTLTDEKFHPQGITGLRKVFTGTLVTPSKIVNISTILLQTVFTLPVQNIESDVEIWANSETEPDNLCILIT